MAQREPQKDYQEWIGEGITDVREAARLTQPQLALHVGVSKQTVYNMEHGVVRPKEEMIGKIASVCAGQGWLADDADALEEYMLGMRGVLPLEMRRSSRPTLRLVEAGDQPTTSGQVSSRCFTQWAPDLLEPAA
jgi:DNA-binding XRE family transcriptional regulator